MWTHNTQYLPLKGTLLQSIVVVTVYHYCPWAIMSQVEGFAVKHSNGAGSRRVDIGSPRQGRRAVEIHVFKAPHVCESCWITSKVELVRRGVEKNAVHLLQYVLVLA